MTDDTEHGIAEAYYSVGPCEPCHGFLIECLCGYSTGRCESWEEAGRDFDEHLGETRGKES